jgi:hypothetical protein
LKRFDDAGPERITPALNRWLFEVTRVFPRAEGLALSRQLTGAANGRT